MARLTLKFYAVGLPALQSSEVLFGGYSPLQMLFLSLSLFFLFYLPLKYMGFFGHISFAVTNYFEELILSRFNNAYYFVVATVLLFHFIVAMNSCRFY